MRNRLGRVGRMAEDVAGALRRRSYDRAPRVLLYDADGRPAVLSPADEAHGDLVAVAARMLELAPESRRSRRRLGERT